MKPLSEAEKRFAILALSGFVQTFIEAGVTDAKSFNQWKKNEGNAKYMAQLFEYPQDAGWPALTGLVKPFFHPTLPLVGLNYTQLAHNTLHEFPRGWTTALRLCRGIVFDHRGNLVALPFMKFFNFGEQPETAKLPNESFEATVKQDGHLGIIFRYNDEFILTTRGDFTSPTAQFANKMLAQYVNKNHWLECFPNNNTALVEIIHPETQVYVDYGATKEFRLIGAFNQNLLTDYNYRALKIIAVNLGLPITPIWAGNNLRDLAALMKDRTIYNQEGYVVCFASGLRVKFKFENYIGLMVRDKLSPAYLMQRMISGNLEKMLLTLPAEIYATALNMLGEILLRISVGGTPKDRWRRLYDLPHTTGDTYFQGLGREFVKQLTKI